MYTDRNFKTKKALREAIAAGERVTYYQPNQIAPNEYVRDGKVTLEGPHYPAAHTWYAEATVADGFVTKVK